MKHPIRVTFILLILYPFLGNAQLTIEEHLGMENLRNPSVLGSHLLFAKTTKESWDGKTLSSLFISDLNGKNQAQLTENEYDYDPRFSPDGSFVSFISYRNNLQQIYIIPLTGGEARLVSDAQAYISHYQWVDNQTIAYVDDEPRDSLLVTQEKENGGGYIVGTEYFTNALWLYNIETRNKQKITDGTYRIVEFDISEDGNFVAIVGAKNYDTYESIVNSWIEVIDIQTGSSVYELKSANALSEIKLSPNNKKLSFVGSTVGFAANDGLFAADLEKGTTKNLTYDFDPTIQQTQWIDDEHISFLTPRSCYTGIYSVNLKGEIQTLLKPQWVVYDYDIDDGTIFFTASSAAKPKQLYKIAANTKPQAAQQLTDLHSSLQGKINTSSKCLTYNSYDSTQVEAVITYPPKFNNEETYPLMVIPHGGPDAVVLNDFHWMGQFFADNGYVVFQPNFRGSIGYGREFYAGNRNAFGEKDFDDIMAGVDTLIELNIADKDRLVIGGWSYGGYMSNWAITQTDRFKASISVGGVSNLVSLYGQHEFSNREIAMWEYKALPIHNVENYRKASPLFFVKQIETPLLILHGANDTRSPTLQAWEMYRAMKDADKTVQMILYPGAGHNISNPAQFKSVLTQWLNWANGKIGKINAE